MKIPTVVVLCLLFTAAVATPTFGQGCPNGTAIGNFQPSNDGLNVLQSSDGTTVTYSILTNNESDGSLIEYCVYPPSNPTSETAIYSGWLTEIAMKQGYFAFKRSDGDPTNIPFDGNQYTVGSATWPAGTAPNNSIILLHINDANECDAIYGGNPGTCFVYPAGAPPPPPEVSISGFKFYDANADGVFDSGDLYLPNWQINMSGAVNACTLTDTNGGYSFTVPPNSGTYTIAEGTLPFDWFNTTPMSGSVTVSGINVLGPNFGNLCLSNGNGQGKTLGFWSNPNGQTILTGSRTGTTLTSKAQGVINGTPLVDAGGNPKTFTSYSLFRSWLLGATATNMAYMLSAQTVTMELNVAYGYVNATAIIYAPGTNSANPLGYAAVGSVLSEAVASLQTHPYTPAGDPARAYQGVLETVLDNANNNLTFVPPTPAGCANASYSFTCQ